MWLRMFAARSCDRIRGPRFYSPLFTPERSIHASAAVVEVRGG